VIFFEGTYTHTFSGNPEPTPRYDYNQMLYKLDLSDGRLNLPVAVYVPPEAKRPDRFVLGSDRPAHSTVAFFALERSGTGTIPVYAATRANAPALSAEEPATNAMPLFHALPSEVAKLPATAVSLYEFIHEDGKRRAYATDASWSHPGFRRSERPVCRVWRVPSQVDLPAD
jgi:hypothetical protein